MAITTVDGLVASAKQQLYLNKTTIRTTVAGGWFTLFDIAGNPGSGTLAGTSTTAGVVPTDATAGFPNINAFAGGATGYLTSVAFGSSVACRFFAYDMLFKAGAYGFATGTTTLSAQPSYVSRLPGSDYTDTQIWIEVSTAFVTGTAWSVQVTYTNQAGTTGRTTFTTGTLNAAALTLGRMYQLGLQAGDTGVQKIDSVVVTNGGTAMTAGAFNVLVIRQLWAGRVKMINDGETQDFTKTMMPEVFADSALAFAVAADSTSSGIPDFLLTVASG